MESKPMNPSHGYDEVARIFIEMREKSIQGIGSETVRKWAKSLEPNSTVLDLGCGSGIPLTKILLEVGLKVYAIDASPQLVREFQIHFPGTSIVCEMAEKSKMFDRKFKGIMAWGLIFLLETDAQAILIHKVSEALDRGGKFLFTSPKQETEWNDLLTGQKSVSLGASKYLEILKESGLELLEEFEDEGENHYFHAIKSIGKN
jgi:2-polyprenyl-3-methyl-5-hydroxy-6-metoxy-1,4-benzoquinol methylase